MQDLDADARDRLMDRLRVDEAEPVVEPDESPWWEQLKFDPDGTEIEYNDEMWRAEDLAAAGAALASHAAAALRGNLAPADVNNRACALVYSEPSALAEPLKLLEGIKGKSKADHNLKVLEQDAPASENV